MVIKFYKNKWFWTAVFVVLLLVVNGIILMKVLGGKKMAAETVSEIDDDDGYVEPYDPAIPNVSHTKISPKVASNNQQEKRNLHL